MPKSKKTQPSETESGAANGQKVQTVGASKVKDPELRARIERWGDEFIENLNRNAKRGEPTS